jgi:hypothetical protein
MNMKERTILIVKLVSSHLILLPFTIFLSLLINSASFLPILICQTLLIILFLSGYWEFLGLKFKIIYSFLIELLILATAVRKFADQPVTDPNPILILLLIILQVFLMFLLSRILIVIFWKFRKSMEIVFPFSTGTYLITDGGNSKISRLMNYHFYSLIHRRNKTNYSMLYATDIVKINNINQKFFPPRNEDYPIYGEKVFSPLSGVVIKFENNIPDNIPYSGGYPYNSGNTIVIKNGNKYLLLGHLKHGSIRVVNGQNILQGDWLAEAGNSGYTERPHIHMQLIECDSESYWKGIGIPILYRYKNLYKNRVVGLEN